MKKAAALFIVGVLIGIGVFYLRKENATPLILAVDALTLSGGGIFLVAALSSLLTGESADGIGYAARAGFLGLFPFARAQSFRRFKEERREKREKTGEKKGLDRESVLFGATLFVIGAVLAVLFR